MSGTHRKRNVKTGSCVEVVSLVTKTTNTKVTTETKLLEAATLRMRAKNRRHGNLSELQAQRQR